MIIVCLQITSKQSIKHVTYNGTLCGNVVSTINEDSNGDLVNTIIVNEDPLHLFKPPFIHYRGYSGATLLSASSHCVEVIKVAGADTDNVLKVVRNN